MDVSDICWRPVSWSVNDVPAKTASILKAIVGSSAAHRVVPGVSLTKVFVGGHPANTLEGDNGQQTRAHEGADPREEKEEAHDGALHGLGGCRISKLQTCNESCCQIWRVQYRSRMC